MAEAARKKIAVVLFNLGGPDNQADVRPFLFNLFRDKAIIALPAPARLSIAFLVSTLRTKTARANYALMGGGSPLLAETQAQADALAGQLALRAPDCDWRVFIGMRYWAPYVADAARAVADWGADEAVLLPLYPQYSTTTTGSSLAEWRRVWKGAPAHAVCCYPDCTGLADAYAQLTREAWLQAGAPPNTRLLFSAHGLPEATVARGDPYPHHVARTAAAIAHRLPEFSDTQICYQSRVGPMKWIGPSTDAEISRAAREGKTILVCPLAFVSDHVETLVELDIEYRHIAERDGAAAYIRVPTPRTHPEFIGALAALALHSLAAPGVQPGTLSRVCSAIESGCILRAAAKGHKPA
jgi:ferrochelatase